MQNRIYSLSDTLLPPPHLSSSVPYWTPASSHLFRLCCLLLLTPLSLYLLLWVGFHVSFPQVCLAISLMLQNFMICLEIKTTLLFLSCGSPHLEWSSLFCWIFAASLRLSLVITCRKVGVALLFSDSSLFCHGCYPIELQFFLYMIILSCQTVSYWKPGRENLSFTIT